MAEAKHSSWGASKFEQIMLCPGSTVLQRDLPNTSSVYADEGTAAHQVLTWALQQGRPAADFVGDRVDLETRTVEVTQEMAEAVQVCVGYVHAAAGDDGVTLVDVRVDYSGYLGLPAGEAYGTADVIVLRDDEVTVIDYKHGMGVEVSAERNPQMSLYALGALAQTQGILGDFTRVRMTISQPRIRQAASEWTCTVDELEAWAAGTARSAVATARNAEKCIGVDTLHWNDTFLNPGEKQCKFCRAKATCPALRDEVADTVFDDKPASPDEFGQVDETTVLSPQAPTDGAWLAACLSKVDMIEDWCKAVRAEAERRMLAGEKLPGYKLVQGKRGARQWADAAAAEELLRKVFRLPVEKAYDLKLISPTSAEKLFKAGDIGPRQWPKATALVVQPEGKLHVAPVYDSRPAVEVTPVVEDFDNVTSDNSDLA